MKKYRNKLKIDVLLAMGSVDVGDVKSDVGEYTELDDKIIDLASKYLSRSEKITFFYAYHCIPSWEEIQERFYDDLGENVKVETLVKYGNRAEEKIKAKARTTKYKRRHD